MGVSENSVPLNPMVNDQTIPIKLLFHWEYTQHFQTNPDHGPLVLSALNPPRDSPPESRRLKRKLPTVLGSDLTSLDHVFSRTSGDTPITMVCVDI